MLAVGRTSRAGIDAAIGIANRADGMSLHDASLIAKDPIAREKSRRDAAIATRPAEAQRRGVTVG